MTVFNLPEFEPYQRQWNARIELLHLRESYYTGDVFQPVQLRQQLGNSLFPRLYKNIKPLFLPISRAVDVDVGLVPNRWRLVDSSSVPVSRLDSSTGKPSSVPILRRREDRLLAST